MFDVARFVALFLAAIACIRPRFGIGIAVAIALAALDVSPILLPLLHRGQAPPNVLYGFALIFWGPSALPTPKVGWRAVDVLDAAPIARTALAASLAWGAAAVAHGRAKPLRPETPMARHWDRVGLRFLFVAVFDTLLVLAGLTIAALEVGDG
jgi:hypothetical protein